MDFGLLTYLSSRREGRDPALVAPVRAGLLHAADAIVRARDEHGHAPPLGTVSYWGCNGSVARQALVLQAANRLGPKPAFRVTALGALNHLFGRNCHGRSFVTSLGDRPPLHPHDRRSDGDKVETPWPGYLIGGAHPRATSWEDEQHDYRTNEIAINGNAALLPTRAGLLDAP